MLTEYRDTIVVDNSSKRILALYIQCVIWFSSMNHIAIRVEILSYIRLHKKNKVNTYRSPMYCEWILRNDVGQVAIFRLIGWNCVTAVMLPFAYKHRDIKEQMGVAACAYIYE